MIGRNDYLYFAGRAVDGMVGIVTGLGDELANRIPPLPGANSPFALLTHCLGVLDYWAGALVAGRAVSRDRDAEFSASGSVADLADRARRAMTGFADDVASADPRAPLHATPPAGFGGPPRELDQAAALMHVYEELAQHHGQMEILRDCLVAAS